MWTSLNTGPEFVNNPLICVVFYFPFWSARGLENVSRETRRRSRRRKQPTYGFLVWLSGPSFLVTRVIRCSFHKVIHSNIHYDIHRARHTFWTRASTGSSCRYVEFTPFQDEDWLRFPIVPGRSLDRQSVTTISTKPHTGSRPNGQCPRTDAMPSYHSGPSDASTCPPNAAFPRCPASVTSVFLPGNRGLALLRLLPDRVPRRRSLTAELQNWSGSATSDVNPANARGGRKRCSASHGWQAHQRDSGHSLGNARG